ncbi:MAG: DUF2291 family protein [Shinella sp.]|nr:DUF2291 family protein [Shinella sp.]
MASRKAAVALALVCAMGLAGCKIIKTPTAEERAQAASGGFNPDSMAAEIWEQKIVPYLNERAGPFQEVAALAAGDPEAAGAKYGHKEKQGSAPWTFAAKVSGKIVAEELQSRSAYVDVDVDGDAKADVRVQVGPAIRGTALRDSLNFVNFNEFKNQIEWAQFGRSINNHVNALTLEKLPRQNLIGKTVEAVGAYPLPAKGQLPLFVPATITIGG